MPRGEFYTRFPDDASCARFMARERWPDGFKCPKCGMPGWELQAKRFTWECRGCGTQTSVTAGTVMHRSKVGLRKWFELIHMMTSHSNGISAEQAHQALGLGSYNTAWLMLQKLRRAMVDPERAKLAGTVEVDETSIPFRTVDDPVAGGQGRSPIGKLPLICAVELNDKGNPRRIRLARIDGYGHESLHAFIKANVAPKATVRTDGNPSYRGIDEGEEAYVHKPRTIGKLAAHVFLKWVHRAIGNMKRWFTGTFHGIREAHLQRYMDEYVFRWNRRRHFASAFPGLVGFAARMGHASYRDLVDHTV